MGTEQRQQYRNVGSAQFAPIECQLVWAEQVYAMEVVNYHFRGACLRFKDGSPALDTWKAANDKRLAFYLGREKLKADLGFRIVWEDTHEALLGVAFEGEKQDFVDRAQRIHTHARIKPSLTAADPLDPHRQIFFVVEDISPGGLQVSTSLTNRHLFPGMELRQASLTIPGAAPLDLSCAIQNTRAVDASDHFRLGLAIIQSDATFRRVIAQYLLGLGSEGQLATIQAGFGKTKSLQTKLSFKLCLDANDYEKVLKLRLLAYGFKGKLQGQATWQEQGDGLEREGHIIMCFLGGELVATAEIRLGHLHQPFRTEGYTKLDQLDGISFRECMEVNKLAVHPEVQSTDVLMGMVQKIHAQAVMHRVRKTVILATDQLKGLYLRLGAKEMALRFPHPNPKNGYLNVLSIDDSTFSQGEGLNPLAWQMIYGGISAYMAEKGVIHGHRLGKWARGYGLVAAGLQRWRHKAKKTTSPKATVTDTAAHGFQDPRWTKPHFASEILAPFVAEADLMAGSAKVDSILDALGVSRDNLQRPGNWFSVAFFDQFLDRFAKHGSLTELCRRAGQRAMSRESLGVQYFLIRHLATPAKALAGIQRIAGRFNQTRFFQVETKGPAHLRLILGCVSPDLLPKHRESCDNWLTCLETAMSIFADYRCQVHKTSCCYDGDSFCSYDISWERRPSYKRWVLGTSALGLGGFAAQQAWSSSASMGSASALHLAAGSLAVLGPLALWWQHRRHQAARELMAEQFNTFKQESIHRYRELQQSREKQEKRYRELKVIEQAVQLIQAGSDLQDILQRTLSVTSEHFHFDRAFVMLKDEQGRYLHTAAMDGIERGAELIWRFKVAIDQKRDNPQVLSSVFHSGHSILIADVEKHLFQLNKESRQILHELGSQSFIIAPIKSSQSTWGVIAVDRKSRTLPLERYELIMLERVAAHLALALDKEAKLQHEQNLRRVFQKYAPLHVVNEAGSRRDPVLGGQSRTVSCFFLDIRSFTRMSEQLPPEMTLRVLNRFFDLCQRLIAEHKGVIDKFLGDGLLATWGAVPGSPSTPDHAVAAAEAIIAALPDLNTEFKKDGLRPLEIGIGAHWGDCVVGNMGSQERMEFTCIGRTINMAARLEGLCKEFCTNFIISQATREALPLPMQRRFDDIHGVSIRGIEGQVGISYYKKQNEEQEPFPGLSLLSAS